MHKYAHKYYIKDNLHFQTGKGMNSKCQTATCVL